MQICHLSSTVSPTGMGNAYTRTFGYQLPPPTLHLQHLPGVQQCKNWGCSMSQGYICAWDGAVVNPRDAAVSGMRLQHIPVMSQSQRLLCNLSQTCSSVRDGAVTYPRDAEAFQGLWVHFHAMGCVSAVPQPVCGAWLPHPAARTQQKGS